jgi:colanic acid biosynthesis glycosyl transferase WcaI
MAKILIIGINFAPELIGVGKYSGELANYLANAGDDVRVITAPPHYPNWIIRAPYSAWRFKTERIGSVDVFRCPIWTRNHGRGIWRILAPLSFAIAALVPSFKQMLVWRPDVIVCVEPSFFSCIMPVLLARLLRMKSVLHVQDLEIDAAFAVGYISGSYFKAVAFTVERIFLSCFD